MQDVVPKLKPIRVQSQKLLLDPNNPRFTTKTEERVPEDQLADPGIINSTYEKMLHGANDPYRIEELKHSIVTNGWQPVDSIFVRPYRNGLFMVLEGNRRVTAVQELLKSDEIEKDLRAALQEIAVMEVEGLGDPEARDRQIAYLLGVRHHGSLKQWSPFAQARNIFACYLERAGIATEEQFQWKKQFAEEVADALSIPLKKVEERLSVYRAMVSVSRLPKVGKENIKDHYYSLFAELINRKKSALGKYIVQEPLSLLLDQKSAEKMEDLCHFSDGRKESPIGNPQEWRPLNRILEDVEGKREENLARVEIGKEPPSVVWAQREEELRKLEWSTWFVKVRAILGRVKMEQIDPDDVTAKEHIARLAGVLKQLETGA